MEMIVPEEQATAGVTGERADLIESLRGHRAFLLRTVQGLDDEQASRRSTVSELDLAGLIKHVAATEAMWVDFARRGPSAFPAADWSYDRRDEFHLVAGETVAGVVARYAEVAAATDELAATADLDVAHPLPDAPWFPPDTTRSVRRVLVHIIAETAQHAGHADILREAIDGARTMG